MSEIVNYDAIVTIGDFMVCRRKERPGIRYAIRRSDIVDLSIGSKARLVNNQWIMGPDHGLWLSIRPGVPFELVFPDGSMPERALSWFLGAPAPALELFDLSPEEFDMTYKAFCAEGAITTARVAPAPDEGLNVEKSQEEGLWLPRAYTRKS